MGRIPTKSSGDRLTSAIWNNLRADYLSQTDTTLQNILSSLDWSAGKRPKFPFAYFDPTTAPAATEGHVYYDNTTKKLRLRDDTQWRDIPATVGGGGSYKLSPSYTIYKDGSTYYAMDTDGDVDYSGAVFHTIFNNASSALTNGGLIHLKGNTTYTALDQLLLKNTTTLEGEGWDTIIELGSGHAIATNRGMIENNDAQTGTRNRDIVIRNLALDGNDEGVANPPTHWCIGVNFEGVERCRITGIKAHNWSWFGARLRGNVGAWLSTYDSQIDTCWFQDNPNGAAMLTGFAIDDIFRCSINNCYATNSDTALAMYYGNDCEISHNKLWGNINNSDGYTNYIDIADHFGLRNKITDNICMGGDATKAGIVCIQTLADPERTLIANNQISSHISYDIRVEHNAAVVGNVIHVGDTAGNWARGVNVRGDNNVVAANKFQALTARGRGVWFDDTATNDNIVIGNNFSGFSQIAVNLITVANTDNVISENQFVSCATCINLDGNATRTRVLRNEFISCTTPCADAGVDTRFNQVQVPIFDDGDAQAALANIGDHVAIQTADGQDVPVRFNFQIPSDCDLVMSANIKVVSVCAGGTVMRWNVTSDFGAANEAYNVHSDTIAATDQTLAANALEFIDLSAALTGAAAGDSVGICFTREGSHVNDTLGDTLEILGFTLNYV